MSVLELFCAVDDFCIQMESEREGLLLGDGKRQRQRAGQLCESEALTIMIPLSSEPVSHLQSLLPAVRAAALEE